RDNYELFGLVYGFAAQRAIARAGPELVERLIELKNASDATDDPVEFGRLATAFQAAVVDAAQSPKVKAVLRALPPLLPGGFLALVPDAQDVWRRGVGRVLKPFRRGGAEAPRPESPRTMP